MTVGLEEYFNHLKAQGRAAGTIIWKQSHLQSFQAYLNRRDIHDFTCVTTENIRAYLAELAERQLSFSTRQAHLSAIKGLFSYLFKQGLITANPAAPVETFKKTAALPRVPSEAEIAAILAAPDLRTPVGVRDRAILELLYSSGIRRQELVNLDLVDIDLEKGYLRINQGKNQKDRIVPVGEIACKFLEAYLKLVRWWFLRNPSETALFLGSQSGERLAVQTVNYIVKKAARKSRAEQKTSPHTFRHSMATHLLQNKADIRSIQMMLGHASVTTTEIYTQLSLEDLKEVYRRAHPHGKR